jgi:hypothetical protein
MEQNNNTESLFVKLVNENAEKVHFIAKLNSMTEEEKVALIEEFISNR